MFEKMTTC